METNHVAALNDFLRRHPSGNLTRSLTWVMEQHGPDEQGDHVAILKFRGGTVGKGEDASKTRAIQAAAKRALEYFRDNEVPDPEDEQNSADINPADHTYSTRQCKSTPSPPITPTSP